MLKLVLGLAALIAMAAAVRTVRLRRRETLQLQGLARKHRLNFSRLDLIGLHDRYHNLGLIRQGHNRHVWNILYGSHAAGLLAVFRYRYDLGFAASRQTRHLWVAVVETAGDNGRWLAIPADSSGLPGPPHQASASGSYPKSRLFVSTGRMEWFTPTTENPPNSLLLAVPGDTRPVAPELHPIFTAADNSHLNPHMEACGPLLAVAVETSESAALPQRLLDLIADLAHGSEQASQSA